MTTPKEFRWGRDGSPPELSLHSEAKLRVFRYYLSQYLDILTQTRRRRELKLTIVDGFSGGGYYSFNGEEVNGSPLVILEEIEAAERRINLDRPSPVSFSIHSHFVDSRKNNLSALKISYGKKGTVRESEPIFIFMMGRSKK